MYISRRELISPLRWGQPPKRLRTDQLGQARMRSKREIDWEERKWQPVLDEILPVYAHFKCNLDDLVKAYQEGRVPENFYVLKRKRLEARMDKLIDQCIRNRDKRSYKISSLRQGFI